MQSNALAKRGKYLALKVVASQFVITIIAALSGLLLDTEVSISIFIGGMICVVPNCYFALKAFSKAGAQQAQLVVKAFYLGEAVKIMLTVVLFIVAFKLLDVSPGSLFLGYVLALVVNWMSLFMLRSSY